MTVPRPHPPRSALFFAAVIATVIGGGATYARAQQFPACPVPGSVGPDVIVGDLNSVQNYATVGALDAIAIGTVSCNIGTDEVNWIANSNQHPVIGGSLYRFSIVNGAGRFEQIGQSWVKHGFAALSQSLCCANCAPSDGLHLGVGCSDPYAAPRNGTQAGLGPKYQVSPHSGSFVFPPPHPTGGNNGRIQFDVADVELTGAPGAARFFGEAFYMAPDDARANNGDNNASWRELSVAGSSADWTLAVVGATTRMQSAIEVWPTLESGVTLRVIDFPEGTGQPFDGFSKYVLGSKVTPLGGGQWHYEYALYDMNSDAATRLFRLTLGPGVVLTNIGFHDVDYRGGDGPGNVDYDGTDWTVFQTTGEVQWSTSAFLQNTRANALRWGTTYNFRFDADAPPGTGDLTLAAYRGAQGVTVSGVDVPRFSQPGQPMCFGDGQTVGLAACPCANDGSAGHGCANSANAEGALLSAGGPTSPDSVVLGCTGMSASGACLFLAGDDIPGGAVFGDGVICVGGALIRLGSSALVAGAAQYPTLGAAPLSVAGATPPGSGLVGRYQVVYRNAAAAFCPPGVVNTSNSYQITW